VRKATERRAEAETRGAVATEDAWGGNRRNGGSYQQKEEVVC
jgi:hypothetical protein